MNENESDSSIEPEVYSYLFRMAQDAVKKAMGYYEEAAETVEWVRFVQNDISSALDKVLDAILAEHLAEAGLAIISEETYSANSHESLPNPLGLYWMVDPLDGTYNSWRGIPHFAISVALMSSENPVFGVIGFPHTREIYSGGLLSRAEKNGKEIRVSKIAAPQRRVLATGIPIGSHGARASLERVVELAPYFGKIRMLGSAATSLCLLAEGKLDAYFEDGIFLWDVMAGVAVATAAGAKVQTRPSSRPRVVIFACVDEISGFSA